MNPEFIDGMSWQMAEVYGAITDQILINLAHYFPYYKPGQPLPQSSFEYQANMLAQMGQVSKDTIRIIRNGLAGADGALQGVLEQAIIDSVRKAQPELLEAVKQGVLSPISKPVVSPSQMRAFNLYYTQAADKLNLVNTVMLESTQSAYQQCVSDVVSDIGLADSMNRVQIALDTAAGGTVTGVESWNRALQHATDRLKEAGIVGFIDHAGRRWSAEAYVAMDIRTTVANTARAAVWETNQDFGNDLYQVSYHDGARPLCYPWQLKVISSTDNARTVTDLDGNEIEVIAQSATSYGKPAGLFGINCKHNPTPFIPGVSIIRGQVQPEKANEIAYEQSQEQRRLERKLREERRNILMAKAQGASPEEIGRLQAKANKTSADIDEFCAQTGLPRQRNRERVYTKREFPDANRYDVNAFERAQKEAIDKYFDNGGAQQGFTFGQMTPNTTTPSVAETQSVTALPHPTTGTMQMYDEALQWAEENYASDLEDLREGFGKVETQVKAFDEFAAEIPKYEQTIKDAINREDFAMRTSSSDIVHILEEGRFKSQIESGASHGYLDIQKRKRAAEQLFAYGEQLDIPDSGYEIYGYLGKAPRADMYGNVRVVFNKNRLIDRTTVTLGDSLELIETGADPFATLATNPKIVSYGKVFSHDIPNAPQRLADTRRDFASIADKGYLDGGNYIELQFHGGVTTADIEYIEMSAGDANANKAKELSERAGVKIKWKR